MSKTILSGLAAVAPLAFAAGAALAHLKKVDQLTHRSAVKVAAG